MQESAVVGDVFALLVCPCFDMSIAKLNEMNGLTSPDARKS